MSFNGLGMRLGNLARLSSAQTRLISPEIWLSSNFAALRASQGQVDAWSTERRSHVLRDILQLNFVQLLEPPANAALGDTLIDKAARSLRQNAHRELDVISFRFSGSQPCAVYATIPQGDGDHAVGVFGLIATAQSAHDAARNRSHHSN
jgi:hypothetical protein